jgi:hypothetical protein
MSEVVILEANVERNKRLYISECAEPGKLTLFCLDCDFDTFGKQFIELPRFYKTVRGSKSAAARLVEEKIIWSKP